MQQTKKEERVHQVFQSISHQYDFMNSVISFRRHIAWRNDTMRRMQVQKGATALDVCCGTGDWTLALAQAVGPSGQVYGLDFSPNMLDVGQQKINAAGLTNTKLIHGNAMQLPFPDNTFDYVTIGFGLRNLPDYMKGLQEMHRVVKPGGQVVCLETSQPTLPVYKQCYYFYFRTIMPRLGKILAKSFDQYTWLEKSARSFPNQQKLAGMFRQVGLVDITVKSYTGGVAAMHLGFKAIN